MRQVWTYKARNERGEAVKGEIESETIESAADVISSRRLILVDIKPRSKKPVLTSIMGQYGSTNREKLIIFTRKLRTLYKAGIPLLRSLEMIARSGNELGMSAELSSIIGDLESGQSLSAAMGRFPAKFPPVYVASVAAGESSGTLDEVLSQLAILVEKELTLSRQVKSALRYPAMVIFAITAAIIILMTFVIPKFAGLYGKYGAELPLPTRIVIGTSNFFSSYWYVIIIVIALGIYGLKRYLSTEKGRLKWDNALLRLPIIGDLVLKANIARFANLLKTLFKSGIPMVACLNILQETSANKQIANEIGILARSFEKGQELGGDLSKYRHFPPLALEMFQVGLESGSVEAIMQELATHYELELDYKSRHLAALIEPILTVFIGAMVLLLALSIFLPMWNLIKVFR